ncbi:CLUMA_CG006860, isoform A [Clunio marinus]|uniref:CLUMA_CG006860, isoform A n=1 Tax=Clunio marinus TaxID=568069 RepID=A0A1J1HYZ3_9DIPT|nr:CLUMA_CG006860, isoform A [Clunio marinus]
MSQSNHITMKFTKLVEWMLIQSGLQFFTFMILADFALTLKDVRVLVPAAVRRGENVNLICQYDLEGDTLYSMKWYKGKREFFRFTPKENPSLQIFPVQGIYVETSKSNRSYITLKSVEPSISGKYVCEISADAPSFHTELVSSEMEVVDVPQNKPVITEIKPHYRIGELIRGNCTSQYSRPAANLTWLVNNNPIAATIRQYPSVKDETRNLFSNTIGLFLRLTPQHFANGRLKISCIARLYTLYNERVDKIIDEDRPTVFSASASQSFIDMPSSHYSSYHDSHDSVNNHNDAQIQADSSSIGTSFMVNICRTFILLSCAFIVMIHDIMLK